MHPFNSIQEGTRDKGAASSAETVPLRETNKLTIIKLN